MKPEQFIRDFGVEKARAILNDTPAQSYFTCFCKDCGWGGSSQKLNVNGYDRDWIACPECYSEKIESEDFVINDLKRLVESVDRVNEHGGYLAAKELLSFSIVHQEAFGKDAVSDETINSLKAAIRDHESIYGGGE